jgi:valyl-tRNA synthetase
MVAVAPPARCPHCGSADLIQDPDVLDTWFSSALWPFSTLGWPQKTKALELFYPTSALVTSFDILFFWVARMIMMGLHFMKDVPFKDVYIHALVRDAEGQKMSKSKGNVIDPLAVMEKYGTDALRFTLASMASPGRDIRLSEDRIEGYRNFANKIWNAARFLLMNCPSDAKTYLGNPLPDPGTLSLADRWILSRLQRAVSSINRQLEDYRFDEASKDLYQFVWHELCDWYLELIKPILCGEDAAAADRTRTVAIHVFETVLRLLHPFMPFITEELYQMITPVEGSVTLAPFPAENTALVNEAVEQECESFQRVVEGIREIRGLHGIPFSKKLPALIRVSSHDIKGYMENNHSMIMALSGLSELKSGPHLERPVHALTNPIAFPGGHAGEIFIPLTADTIDVAKEITKKEKRLKELTAQMEQELKKLSNADFAAKAPPEVLEKTKIRHEELRLEHETVSTAIKHLREISGGNT